MYATSLRAYLERDTSTEASSPPPFPPPPPDLVTVDDATEVLFRRCLRQARHPCNNPALVWAREFLAKVPRDIAEKVTRPAIRDVCVSVFDKVELHDVENFTPQQIQEAMQMAIITLSHVYDRVSFFRAARFFFSQNGEFISHTTVATPNEFVTALEALHLVIAYGDSLLYDWRPPFRDLLIDNHQAQCLGANTTLVTRRRAIDLCVTFAHQLAKAGCFEATLRVALLRAMRDLHTPRDRVVHMIGIWSHERVTSTPTLIKECLQHVDSPECRRGDACAAIIRKAASPEDMMEAVVFCITSEWRFSEPPPASLLNAIEDAFKLDKSLFVRFTRSSRLLREAMMNTHVIVASRTCWIVGEIGSTEELAFDELLGFVSSETKPLVMFAMIGALLKYGTRAPHKYLERAIAALKEMPECFERDDAITILTTYPHLAQEFVTTV